MKALLVAEYRQGKLLESSYELLAFAARLNAEIAMFVVGEESQAPTFGGKVYLAEASTYGEYNPALHKRLILEAVRQESPDAIVFLHSAYGWDLAPRLAVALKAAQVSEISAVTPEGFEVPLCNAKLRRLVKPRTSPVVLTIQAGTFSYAGEGGGTPKVIRLALPETISSLQSLGYEIAEKKEVDLSKAAVIVSAGRGVGKKENVEVVASLARALGGELGATRPVVDSGWVDHSRQVGSSGQTVSPKLYVACGISGAIQHIAGMKKSEFVVAINKDKDAPIGEVADVLVVADLLQLIPALLARLGK